MAIYAVSDLHGCYKAWQMIKVFLNPEDTVYVLGDCGDRGPEPWDTLKRVLLEPQVIYLKGNHDDMLIKAAREVMSGSGYHRQRDLYRNGGAGTLDGLLGEEKTDMWISEIAKCPSYIELKNANGQDIFLCHAGMSHGLRKELPEYEDLIWDRLHYFDHPDYLDDVIVVHGHTPMPFIAEDLEIEMDPTKALCYADGKKYCIDAGTVWTGIAILLNLDTFESVCFNIND